MTDTTIKGTGNSRSLRSVPNLRQLAPTYDDLLDLLMGDGVPIDLGPLNPAGLLALGTALVKATLLSDETETALWGDVADRTPTEALKRLRQLINTVEANEVKITSGSYVGAGTHGESNQNSLSFPFAPKLIMLTTRKSGDSFRSLIGYASYSDHTSVISTDTLGPSFPESKTAGGGFSNGRYNGAIARMSDDRKTIFWYCPDSRCEAVNQFNEAGNTYYYIAVG